MYINLYLLTFTIEVLGNFGNHSGVGTLNFKEFILRFISLGIS